MKESGYRGDYCCIYPIKVNQQRQVVEEVLRFGRPYQFGLEAGSKPELLAVIALADNDTPIICNGFKDAEVYRNGYACPKNWTKYYPSCREVSLSFAQLVDCASKIGVRPNIGNANEICCQREWPMARVSWISQ
jgi:arginine decarboxylase